MNQGGSKIDIAQRTSKSENLVFIEETLSGHFAKKRLFFPENSVWAKIARTGPDGKTYLTDHYCLDAVISIGKRINPKAADALEEFVKDRLKKHKREGGDTIIIYNNGNISLPVTISPNEETVWLSKDQIVLLFDTARQNVEYHIANIYEQRELEPETTCKEILQVQSEGGRNKNRLKKRKAPPLLERKGSFVKRL